MYTRDNYILAKEEIEKRRLSAIALADERNEELRLQSEEIAEMDKELTKTGLNLFKIACSGGDIAPLRKRNRELVEKRRKLVVKLGYPEDYSEVKYTCKKCSDTGFIGTKICSCLKELYLSKNMACSGMGNLIEKQSFDNFDLEWYRDDESNYKKMKRNLAVAKKFALEFGSHQDNLLLIGTTGTGKTHISTSIAKIVLERGFNVLYDSAQNIVCAFENDRFRSGYGPTERTADKYMECDLLILDDLGNEFLNQFTVSVLYNLINTRQNRGLSTIISTNLSAEELAAKYEGRISSRIVGSGYKALAFGGRDHRIF